MYPPDGAGSAAFVLWRNERERRDGDRQALAAQLGKDSGCGRCERSRQITHCYGRIKAGTKAA
jgi:hypothetical protein